MKLEDLSVGAVIMHADSKTNPLHTGVMYIVLKIDEEIEVIDVCCINCQLGTAIGEVSHIPTCSISEYNMLFRIGVEPLTPLSKDLWLRWTSSKTSLGKVGELTPYRDKNGRPLHIGDTVRIKSGDNEHRGVMVVRDDIDGYFIMGISANCDSKSGTISRWSVEFERSYKRIQKGCKYAASWNISVIEAVDFIPEVGDENSDKVGREKNPIECANKSLWQCDNKSLWLRWLIGDKTSLGKIGDKTPYKLENGRNLFVGDIVKISREGEEQSGCLVVHDTTDGYYIMGIATDCNDRKCKIERWNVTLESAFYNRLKGDTYTAGYRSADIEVVDFNPEE